ncbi:hypothetical protein ESCO_000327 [Escovopsis weberi]|uniref:SprT-like domain-containing protein n=1 Tax=Escovopsis weberi TaxID=150374 RepID=A0A0M8MUR3_ESCWE|nr:hypothetical protein ESCO_000327 [Escovopsis weberi]
MACVPACRGITKRPRLDDWGRVVSHRDPHGFQFDDDHGAGAPSPSLPPSPAPASSLPCAAAGGSGGSVHVKNLAFLVIREREPSPIPPMLAISLAPEPLRPASSFYAPHYPPFFRPLREHDANAPMERTQSGLSISSDTSAIYTARDAEADSLLLSDLAAADLVRRHVASMRSRRRDSQHGRILQSLIRPRHRGADFPLDNDALTSIFSSANELFFANRLAQRVAWDWSHPASAQYQSHIVGTTALRRSARLGGYETLIVLSSPILRDTRYNRRLLISTFLHEMIHSFLFIACGFKARLCGGHTEGFRLIAEVMDDWVGKETLRLRDMEADLERFIDDGEAASAASALAPCPGPGPDPPQSMACPQRGQKSSSSGGISIGSDACARRDPYGAPGQHPEWDHDWYREAARGEPMIEAPQPFRRPLGEWEWHRPEGFRAPGLF